MLLLLLLRVVHADLLLLCLLMLHLLTIIAIPPPPPPPPQQPAMGSVSMSCYSCLYSSTSCSGREQIERDGRFAPLLQCSPQPYTMQIKPNAFHPVLLLNVFDSSLPVKLFFSLLVYKYYIVKCGLQSSPYQCF